MPTVHLLDYVAGNIRSLVNAIEKLGYQVEWIKSPEDVSKAEKLILPGVGHFGHCLSQLSQAGYLPAVQQHIAAGKPFFAVCVGLQALFQGSVEDRDVAGLGVIPSTLDRFSDADKPVPHIGWNSANTHGRAMYDLRAGSKYYYVHSYKCPYKPGELEDQGWTVATGTYGNETFIGAIAKGNIYATQFHPEKSGVAGLRTLRAFLTGTGAKNLGAPLTEHLVSSASKDGLTRRVLRQTSRTVFVPLTIGGGIRDTVDTDGTKVTALEIATMYFKSGADKVSVGSDAVIAAEEYYSLGKKLFGNTAIEQISRAYGNQAVVVSVDPKRVYVPKRDATRHALVETATPGPKGEPYCWYACTIKGGRETRDMDVVELAQAVEAMGCGELLLNCIDKDGTSSGFDLELIAQVKAAVTIPVIASSGAGVPAHFDEVFCKTTTDAALGAGMFHRGEYTVKQVKEYLDEKGLVVRKFEDDLER
ncbi:hypothetical protein LLEC1_03730 [Akanthomyces lecanii]|uniref:Glutamine amidotransferase domain-containing protein n=1 Tax=Cordyceps confragosa TaxID=2714763 RepID=A0A179I0M7_CORDF|nr:hypothetical protein LLEC1_03730 [Akanthomyces lecanii]